MLTDGFDEERLRRGVEMLNQLVDHEAFRMIATAEPTAIDPDEIRALLGDYVHAAGTCAMGTVVDARCRLIGYENVVVCDASVMPNAPRANTHLPTVMVAERVAAMLGE
jgi:choline dehydrogenase-like flavoprotein